MATSQTIRATTAMTMARKMAPTTCGTHSVRIWSDKELTWSRCLGRWDMRVRASHSTFTPTNSQRFSTATASPRTSQTPLADPGRDALLTPRDRNLTKPDKSRAGIEHRRKWGECQ